MLKFSIREVSLVDYTNYKGNRGLRLIIPQERFIGETEFHEGKQELLRCFDLDRVAERTYALCDIHDWIDDEAKVKKMLNELGWQIRSENILLNAERKALKDKFGELYFDLSALLVEYNLVNLKVKNNDTEYEPEVDSIIEKLPNTNNVNDVANVIYNVFEEFFGDELIPDKSDEVYLVLGYEIWKLWEKQRN